MHRFSIAQGGEHELLFSAILVVMFSIYVFQAQRIVYDASVRGAAIRTIALTLSIGCSSRSSLCSSSRRCTGSSSSSARLRQKYGVSSSVGSQSFPGRD